MRTGSMIGETAWAECESVIRRFEDAWRERGRPNLHDFCDASSPHSVSLLVELVHIDLEFRIRGNEFARSEDYLERFPQLREPAFAIDLLTAEFALRARFSPPVWPEELWLRFPEYSAELRARLPLDSKTGWLAATRQVDRPGAPLAGLPVIAGYEIQGELGRGGMGVVYKARDQFLHRTVAIKTFATVPWLESCARFAREAEAIARLDHPHIVPVYEVGEWRTGAGPAVPYFVMKWYPGGSMDASPAGRGTDVAAHAKAVETIARAVHHAHQRGVLHRDLKPSNILLDDTGRPHVADFGLAGRLDADAASFTAVVAGTPAYMAPEQALTPKEVSTAADVYGLGAILYHQLTGVAPFVEGMPLATLDLVVNAPPQRPSAINPSVPRDLDTITLKCLEKDPARRYASAADLADDLDRWRTGVPIAARPTRAWEYAWRRVRRHPLVASLVLTTLAALVTAVVVLSESNARIREKEAETVDAYKRELRSRCTLEDALAREQRSRYLDRVTLAGQLYAANQLPQAGQLLDQCPEQYRGWEWRYLDSLRRNPHLALTGHTALVTAVTLLPDGRPVSADVRGTVRVWDGVRRETRLSWSTDDVPVGAVAAHPGRNWVAVANSSGVTVRNADTGRTIARLKGADWVGFTPNGAHAVTADDATIRVWVVPKREPEAAKGPDGASAVPTWELAGELRGHEASVIAGAFTADGKRLVTCSVDRTIRTWDIASRAQLASRRVSKPVAALAVTAGGTVLAEAHLGQVLFTDLETGLPCDRLEYSAGERIALASDPDQKFVAISGANGEVTVWDAARRRTTRVYRGHSGRVAALAFAPGNRIASAGSDQVVRVWDASKEPDARTVAWVGDGVSGLAVSQDGSCVAVGPRLVGKGLESRVLVLDTATGQELRRLSGGPDVGFLTTPSELIVGRPGGGVIRWDVGDSREVWNKPSPEPADVRIAVAPGGRRMAATPDGRFLAIWDRPAGVIRLWSTADGSEVGRIDIGKVHVYSMDFSADGARLAVAASETTQVWNVRSGTRSPWVKGVPGAFTVGFSPNGAWVASIDLNHEIRLHEAMTGREAQHFKGTAARANVLCFSPDSTRMATGGADRTVRIWDVESGRELLTLTGMAEGITGVAWDGKNDRLCAVGHAVRVWEVK